MTSNHHAPYDLGYTRATMDGTTSRKTARFSKSLKAVLSSDCRLQLAYTKSESLVIADKREVGGSSPLRPIIWGFSSAGRAPALHAGGQRFDPVKLH